MTQKIEVLTLAKKAFLERVYRKEILRSDYIDIRIEQLKVEADNPNNSEIDAAWYNRIIQELVWVKSQIKNGN